MGYTTDFQGSVSIEPPLSEREIEYLAKFANTRRMRRGAGPYFVGGSGSFGQGNDPDIEDSNEAPEGQPGLWCQWVPNEDGTALEWDGGEKFYSSAEWMAYLRTHFIAGAEGIDRPAAALLDPEGMGWLPGGHRMAGVIFAAGEEFDDIWRLEVREEGVFARQAEDVEYPPEGDDRAWEREYDGRLAAAARGDYRWGEEERVPDFATPELSARAEAESLARRMSESAGEGSSRTRPRRGV